MASIADLIAKEFGRVGQPGTQTTTQVSEQRQEPLDLLSALMLMLYSGVFDKKGGGGGLPGVTQSLGTTAVPQANALPDALLNMFPK